MKATITMLLVELHEAKKKMAAQRGRIWQLTRSRDAWRDQRMVTSPAQRASSNARKARAKLAKETP